MKQGVSIALAAVGFMVAGTCAALAAPPVTHKAPAKPVVNVIPRGVRIAGVRVGGMDTKHAEAAVTRAFAKALQVVVDGTTMRLAPGQFATPYVTGAVARAHSASAGDNVELTVSVHGNAVRAFVAKLAKRLERKPVPARLELLKGRPFVSGNKPGRVLRQGPLVEKIVGQLGASTRLPIHAATAKITPGTASGALGQVILINRALNRLTYFAAGQLRRFPVATGQSIYPTPTGTFHIVVKWKNPWWYPPTYDSWARGLSPVPPGPSNPLGSRWMGLSAPGVGIHGTNNPSSIGYSVSHGCIRMQVPDAEWLFDHVAVGTTVFIV
jgi:lipoprotein-anchoring transpeptidase ErfK/SrfK